MSPVLQNYCTFEGRDIFELIKAIFVRAYFFIL
jgi:hypothetical protein